MGSALGALWASGYSSASITEVVRSIDWQQVFSGRRERALIPLSRRMDDVPAALSIGLLDGKLHLPPSRESDYRLNRLDRARGRHRLTRTYTVTVPAFDPSSAALHDGIYGLPFTPDEARVVLVPVPWEATVSYGSGTADGPAAILKASRQVDLLDRETGRPYEVGIAMLEIPAEVRRWSDEARGKAAPVIAAGGPGEDPALKEAVAAVDALGDRMNAWVYDQVRRRLEDGKLVGVVGGDHSVPFGAIRAVAEKHPGLGILHFDAHADLRRAYEGFRWSHASIMHNALQVPGVARIVQVGIRDYSDEEDETIRANPDRIRVHFDPDLRRALFDGESFSRIAGRVVADLPRQVYVSFDIDGLDPALCPHTGTPVLGGLSFAEVSALLRTVVESGRRIVGFDLNEVAPDPEGRSDWDGNVGARVLYKEIGFALLSQRGVG